MIQAKTRNGQLYPQHVLVFVAPGAPTTSWGYWCRPHPQHVLAFKVHRPYPLKCVLMSKTQRF